MTDYCPDSGHYGSDIIVADMRIEIAAPVLTWKDHGLTFIEGKGARRRFKKQKIDLHVAHFTGGEGTARQTFRTLTGRRLGVEFLIDSWGVVWQFADPARIDTFDAGHVNPRSVGTEITCYGFRRPGKAIPRPGRDRPVYTTTLNGRLRQFAAFTPWQLKAFLALDEGLRTVLPAIRRRIPRNGNRRLIRRKLTKAELATFSGVLGHFHVSRPKSDPGTELFDALDCAGY